jgi:hypothetical protein
VPWCIKVVYAKEVLTNRYVGKRSFLCMQGRMADTLRHGLSVLGSEPLCWFLLGCIKAAQVLGFFSFFWGTSEFCHNKNMSFSKGESEEPMFRHS